MTSLHASLFLGVLFLDVLIHGALGTSTRGILSDKQGFHTLKAAARRSSIQRRTSNLNPVHEAELVYVNGKLKPEPNRQETFLMIIEDENHDGQSTVFSSSVHFQSQQPVLILEDMDHLFRDVRCDNGTVDIEFDTFSTFRTAEDAWVSMKGGYIIASHMGCGEEGNRTPF